jgi:hypothetical protein
VLYLKRQNNLADVNIWNSHLFLVLILELTPVAFYIRPCKQWALYTRPLQTMGCIFFSIDTQREQIPGTQEDVLFKEGKQ